MTIRARPYETDADLDGCRRPRCPGAAWAVLLGSLGGRVFPDKAIYPVLLAFGIAGAVEVGVEVFRRVRASVAE